MDALCGKTIRNGDRGSSPPTTAIVAEDPESWDGPAGVAVQMRFLHQNCVASLTSQKR
jgi:hypothetical protein